jgi:hypothetical protein
MTQTSRILPASIFLLELIGEKCSTKTKQQTKAKENKKLWDKSK